MLHVQGVPEAGECVVLGQILDGERRAIRGGVRTLLSECGWSLQRPRGRAQLVGLPARRQPLFAGRCKSLRIVAARFDERTARRENTSGRRVDEVRDTAGNKRQSLTAPVGRERRNAGQQTLGIRMERLLEQPGQRSLLHQTPAVQHAHAVADAHDDAEIVRDEQDRQRQSVAKLLDEVENLRLNRHVKCRRRFVQD